VLTRNFPFRYTRLSNGSLNLSALQNQSEPPQKNGISVVDQRFSISLLGMTAVLMLGVFSCYQDNQPGRGVAEVGGSQIADSRNETEGDVSSAGLTDEEMVTGFTVCMRNHGFNIPDPELNADGTVNFYALKEGVFREPEYKGASTKAFDQCLPLLDRFTVAKDESPEDEIELQDNLLKFAQCLRDNGVAVADPDFSGERESWKSNLQDIKGAASRLEKIIALCSESIFGVGSADQDNT